MIHTTTMNEIERILALLRSRAQLEDLTNTELLIEMSIACLERAAKITPSMGAALKETIDELTEISVEIDMGLHEVR